MVFSTHIAHDSTGEKPSFLLYGVDCRSTTEAALMPPSDVTVKDLDIELTTGSKS